MAVSADKFQHIPVLPIPYPSVLVALGSFSLMPVYMVDVESQGIIEVAAIAFVAQIVKQLRFCITIVLGFPALGTRTGLAIALLLAHITAISQVWLARWLTTDGTFLGCPAIRKVASHAAKAARTAGVYAKRRIAYLAFLCSRHIHSIPSMPCNASEEYCQIARDRLKALDTAVPVAEAKAGQMPLFTTKP